MKYASPPVFGRRLSRKLIPSSKAQLRSCIGPIGRLLCSHVGGFIDVEGLWLAGAGFFGGVGLLQHTTLQPSARLLL